MILLLGSSSHHCPYYRSQHILGSRLEEEIHDPSYLYGDTRQILSSLWPNPSLHPTTHGHGHPSECSCSLPSARTQLRSALHCVEPNPFGPLSLDSPPSYSYPFEYSSTAGPLPLEIPPLGTFPVTPPLPASASPWIDFTIDFTKPQVAHRALNANNDRQRPARDASHPYLPPYSRSSSSRKRVPGVPYESDVHKLQERCFRQGAEPDAIALIPHIFAKGVHKDALVRLRTGEEVASRTFGEGPGPVYLCFLQPVEESSAEDEENQTSVTRYTCRLCPGPNDTKFSWKNERDVLRHLRKQHFGLSEACEFWYVFRPPLSNLRFTHK